MFSKNYKFFKFVDHDVVCEPVNVRVALQGLTLHPREELLEDAQAVLGASLSTLEHLQPV